MEYLTDILRTHPEHTADADALGSFMQVTANCGAVCSICADACLSEDNVSMLTECIRLNLGCADDCAATVRAAARVSRPDIVSISRHLEICAQSCAECADECERHASKHEHCGICAESCRECESECRQILELVRAAAG